MYEIVDKLLKFLPRSPKTHLIINAKLPVIHKSIRPEAWIYISVFITFKYVGCFRKLCRYATIERVNTNAVSLMVWKEKTVHKKDKRAAIYLTTDELDALYNMKLSGTDEEVRDVFYLGILSAQRVSDYSTLDESNFTTTAKGTDIISLDQIKTDNGVKVPFLNKKRILELIRKYDFDFPDVKSRDFNRRIKRIMEKLAESVPSLLEEYPTKLTSAELRREKSYLKTFRKHLKAKILLWKKVKCELFGCFQKKD